jgi:hypothetical protein
MINSLQLTRLARGELGGALLARIRENEWADARAAGQLPLARLGCCAKLEAVGRPFPRINECRCESQERVPL